MITDKMIQYYSLLFFACSILGWCIEVLCKLIQFHRFINRGFLVGPWCPIYGFGAVFISLLLSRHVEDPLAVFGLAILICGILEYSASYMLEKIFHARWWDYSTKKFNLNGRVCADTLLPFGLLGLLLVYAITPVMFSCFDLLSETMIQIICLSLSLLFLVDITISTTTLVKIRVHAGKLDGDSTEKITNEVRSVLAEKSALVRRMMRAFPEARLYNGKIIMIMRERRLQLRKEIKQAKKKTKQRIQMTER